jgi:hypothetical protein
VLQEKKREYERAAWWCSRPLKPRGCTAFGEDDGCLLDPLGDNGRCQANEAGDASRTDSVECASDYCVYEADIARCAEPVDTDACRAPYAPPPAQ